MTRTPTMKPLAVAAALALVAVSACAPQPAPPGAQAAGPDAARQCFHSRNVNGFRLVDEDTVDLPVGASDIYRLELQGGCPDVDWARAIGVQTRGGSQFVCGGYDAEVIVPSDIGPQRCVARSIRMLTPAEVAAQRGR